MAAVMQPDAETDAEAYREVARDGDNGEGEAEARMRRGLVRRFGLCSDSLGKNIKRRGAPRPEKGDYV